MTEIEQLRLMTIAAAPVSAAVFFAAGGRRCVLSWLYLAFCIGVVVLLLLVRGY
ncbi:MAG: hypothetical protein IJ678_04600 [Kiritimatiellae bacterium]|nr:hypothetical protein [Kiritimatiellia bacterium]